MPLKLTFRWPFLSLALFLILGLSTQTFSHDHPTSSKILEKFLKASLVETELNPKVVDTRNSFQFVDPKGNLIQVKRSEMTRALLTALDIVENQEREKIAEVKAQQAANPDASPSVLKNPEIKLMADQITGLTRLVAKIPKLTARWTYRFSGFVAEFLGRYRNPALPIITFILTWPIYTLIVEAIETVATVGGHMFCLALQLFYFKNFHYFFAPFNSLWHSARIKTKDPFLARLLLLRRSFSARQYWNKTMNRIYRDSASMILRRKDFHIIEELREEPLQRPHAVESLRTYIGHSHLWADLWAEGKKDLDAIEQREDNRSPPVFVAKTGGRKNNFDKDVQRIFSEKDPQLKLQIAQEIFDNLELRADLVAQAINGARDEKRLPSRRAISLRNRLGRIRRLIDDYKLSHWLLIVPYGDNKDSQLGRATRLVFADIRNSLVQLTEAIENPTAADDAKKLTTQGNQVRAEISRNSYSGETCERAVALLAKKSCGSHGACPAAAKFQALIEAGGAPPN